MRYPAAEKLEIIQLVEGSHLPVKRTLEKLGVLNRPQFAGGSEVSMDGAYGNK
jgi:putative transposase